MYEISHVCFNGMASVGNYEKKNTYSIITKHTFIFFLRSSIIKDHYNRIAGRNC